ncbi:DUF4097 family beta strand repeat-containing protein [Paramicrobacterium agarici]|uniref:DUF4097 family beta strand repeat-containing protein n=1 Tax=Paramicrobacterium agarici TaxID=630514 RepID=UPI001154EA0D|nr:DUF4097 family beta strand repeat-containing protein [Microbacterium agarici]TQO23396.1 DUF4097 and DUF4098 domain-containing protein YvlB [Microbacterium agarici]
MSKEKWFINPGESRVIDTGIVRSFKVALIGGAIDVIGHDEDSARIEVHDVTGRELKVTIDGDRLEIDHPQLRWENFIDTFKAFGPNKATAAVSVLVPRDIDLSFGVVSATALLSGLETDARLSTVSGEIGADSLTGDLELNAVSGALSVSDHAGAVSVHTVSGDVTASGEIERFTGDTVSGDVFIDARGACDRIRVNSMSGNLTARIDGDVGARCVLNTVSGRMHVDGESVDGTFGRGYSVTTPGTTNVTVEVTANTVSGDIALIRRAQHSSASSVDANGAVQ